MFGTEFYEIRPNLYWTGRTNVWEHEGVRFCALGGAASIDKADRTPGFDWFEGEYTTERQANALIDQVGSREIDIMLTHDAPQGIESKMMLLGHGPSTHNRNVISYAVEAIRPRRLFHGHYHRHLRYVHGVTECFGLSWDGVPVNKQVRVLSLDKVKRRR
jgi:hypothetical protein